MIDFFSINNTLFSVGGTGVSVLEFCSVILGLTTVFLAGRGKSYNYWFGYLYSALLFFLFLQKHLYSSMILQPISLVIAIFGHYRWTHPRKGEENKKRELKISLLTNRQRVIHVTIILLFAAIWGWALSMLHVTWPDTFPMARAPYLDALITATLLTAQYLSAQKKLDCWAAWLVVNTANIILYLKAGLIFMPMVSAAYLIMAVFGFTGWRKEWKKQQYVNN